jgi:hypothetical protein
MERVGYSYARASTGSFRAARRAGYAAPAIAPAIVSRIARKIQPPSIVI